MTFKKINKSVWPVRKKMPNRGQSIFEYFLLTIAVMAIVFILYSSGFLVRQSPADPPGTIEGACIDAFNQAVQEIL